jgi:hypothetical protein
MAIAKVCATVFSCAVKGCLAQPFRMSQRQVGFRNTKEMRPGGKRLRLVLDVTNGEALQQH